MPARVRALRRRLQAQYALAQCSAPDAGQRIDEHGRGIDDIDQEQVPDRQQAHEEPAVAPQHGDEDEALRGAARQAALQCASPCGARKAKL